jgi:hypothetical protein
MLWPLLIALQETPISLRQDKVLHALFNSIVPASGGRQARLPGGAERRALAPSATPPPVAPPSLHLRPAAALDCAAPPPAPTNAFGLCGSGLGRPRPRQPPRVGPGPGQGCTHFLQSCVTEPSCAGSARPRAPPASGALAAMDSRLPQLGAAVAAARGAARGACASVFLCLLGLLGLSQLALTLQLSHQPAC